MLGYGTSVEFVQLCFSAAMIKKTFDLCSTGCKDYQDFVQFIKNLKAGGIMDMRKAISALRFWWVVLAIRTRVCVSMEKLLRRVRENS